MQHCLKRLSLQTSPPGPQQWRTRAPGSAGSGVRAPTQRGGPCAPGATAKRLKYAGVGQRLNGKEPLLVSVQVRGRGGLRCARASCCQQRWPDAGTATALAQPLTRCTRAYTAARRRRQLAIGPSGAAAQGRRGAPPARPARRAIPPCAPSALRSGPAACHACAWRHVAHPAACAAPHRPAHPPEARPPAAGQHPVHSSPNPCP